MPNRSAAALVLRAGDRARLMRLAQSPSARPRQAQRAQIVLLAAEGKPNTVIAELVGVSRSTVAQWRDRYRARGLAGLADLPKAGRPRQVDHRRIVVATLRPPPREYGVTRWSSRLMARHLKISDATVARAWRERGIQPWPIETRPPGPLIEGPQALIPGSSARSGPLRAIRTRAPAPARGCRLSRIWPGQIG